MWTARGCGWPRPWPSPAPPTARPIPATQRALLALTRFDAGRGDADALARLDALARAPAGDTETRKLAWLARAHAASLRCARGDDARADFRALAGQLREARPEGGVLVREIEAAGRGCATRIARR